MTDHSNIPSLEEAKAYIDAIDFSNVIDRVITLNHWKKEDVLKIQLLYRNFLFLCKKYPDEKFPPSEEIDEFWHNHILNTEQYIRDCGRIFGKYLQHDPNVVMNGKRVTNSSDMATQFEMTQALYHKEFGGYIYEVRMGRIKQFFWFIRLLFSSAKQVN